MSTFIKPSEVNFRVDADQGRKIENRRLGVREADRTRVIFIDVHRSPIDDASTI
jgi:hypothetical protein